MEVARVLDRLFRLSSRRRRRLRSHNLLALLIGLVVTAAVGGATDIAYVSVKSQADQLQGRLTLDLQSGQREMEAGKDALKQANAEHDASLVNIAIAHFSDAKKSFMSASQLADESQLLRYLENTPSVGDYARPRHVAVDALAEMGVSLSDAGRDLSIIDAELIMPPAAGEVGRTLLTVLNQAHSGLLKVTNHLDRAQRAASRVRLDIIPSGQQATFVKAREIVNSALGGLAEFERLVPILSEILGGNGPRMYLVEQVNPAELRAGGGFIGTYSLLRAEQGSLRLDRSGNAYDLAGPRPAPWQAGFIPMPMPLREIIPQTSWSFLDSNIYPDFPSNAREAEKFVGPILGHLDGVIAMDYFTVAKLLELTGPMEVPGYGIRVDAGNFISEAVRRDVSDFGAHKLIFSSLARPLMERVSSFPSGQWPALISRLNTLASERHIQAYFNDKSLEDEMDRIGWSGQVNPVNYQDFLMEVESNYFGTKSNYWITRYFVIAITREGDTLHYRGTIDIVNNEPCDIEVRGLYKGNIRLYVGAEAGGLAHNMRGVRYPNPDAPPKTKFLDGWLFVNCGGGHAQAAFAFDGPWRGHGRVPALVYWQKQPGTGADHLDVNWNYGVGTPQLKASGDLVQDRVIMLFPTSVTIGPGNAAQAVLPSLSLS